MNGFGSHRWEADVPRHHVCGCCGVVRRLGAAPSERKAAGRVLYQYRAPPSTEWTTERPECTRPTDYREARR